jgi:hypothetical protein
MSLTMVNWYYNSIIRFLSTISKLVMAENYFLLYHICSKKNDLLLSIADAYKFFFSSGYLNLNRSLELGCLSWSTSGIMQCQPKFDVAYIR